MIRTQSATPAGSESTLTLSIVLAALVGASCEFFLTGSRFFGTEKGWSDWDFFAEDKPYVHEFLRSLGFKDLPDNELVEHYHGDPNIAFVYVHPSNVHVQLVNDAELKLEAQTILRHMCINIKKSEVSDHAIKRHWKQAFRTAQILRDMRRGV